MGRDMALLDRLELYKEYRAEGRAPRIAAKWAQPEMHARKPTAAEIAITRVCTRARLTTGAQDTWRLAYAVARLEVRRCG